MFNSKVCSFKTYICCNAASAWWSMTTQEGWKCINTFINHSRRISYNHVDEMSFEVLRDNADAKLFRSITLTAHRKLPELNPLKLKSCICAS